MEEDHKFQEGEAMNQDRWAQIYLKSILNKPTEEEKKEIESHIKESFTIKSSTYFKFDDESYISLSRRRSYFQVFEINKEKYETKKRDFDKRNPV